MVWYDQRAEQLRQALLDSQRKGALLRTQGTKAAGHAGYAYEGALSGDLADLMKSNVSMESSNLVIQHTMDTANARYAMYEGRYRRMQTYKSPTPRTPGHYFRALTEFANQDVRQSRINQRILAGWTPEQVRDWLMKTPTARV